MKSHRNSAGTLCFHSKYDPCLRSATDAHVQVHRQLRHDQNRINQEDWLPGNFT